MIADVSGREVASHFLESLRVVDFPNALRLAGFVSESNAISIT
jgi:hypothetical protein